MAVDDPPDATSGALGAAWIIETPPILLASVVQIGATATAPVPAPSSAIARAARRALAGASRARVLAVAQKLALAEASAMEATRRQGETFVSTLAHELRQPLSALLVAVEMVGLAPDFATATQTMAFMKRQIDQMNRVVDDLMDAARWAGGKVTIRKQRLDVRDIVRDAVMDISAAVTARGHELVVATALEPLWADADPQRLQQVLSNLLRNAVKYTEPGGRISLTACLGPETIVLRIADSGRGLEPDALIHIFDLYSQVRPFDPGGLGIGLSVVREIVALHEGRIEARSQGAGCGSEFIVTLPLAGPAGRNLELRT